MNNNIQPLVRQLYDVYRYVSSVDGVGFGEIGALLDEVGDGLDYSSLTNGMEVLVRTGLLLKDEGGYHASMDMDDFGDFRIGLEAGLGLNDSRLLSETFENEGIRTISPEGDVEFWKAYVPHANRYLLPYLEGLELIEFAESGRLIRIARNSLVARYIVDSIRKSSKRRKSLDTLMKELEEKRRIGAMGESIAFSYERKRLKDLGRSESPELVSNDYVNAGYDILSYESAGSSACDRYIEVKAVGPDGRFYLSRNELEQAKEKGSAYFIYLVDVTRSVPDDPSIEIIRDPAPILFDKDSDWLSTVESYRFERIGTEEEMPPEGIRGISPDQPG
jgi:hypothetical protein